MGGELMEDVDEYSDDYGIDEGDEPSFDINDLD